MPRPRVAEVIQIMKGTRQPCRARDETIIQSKARGTPELPPWAAPSPDVRRVFEWIVLTFPIPKATESEKR